MDREKLREYNKLYKRKQRQQEKQKIKEAEYRNSETVKAYRKAYNKAYYLKKKEYKMRTIEQICEDLTGINAMVFMRGTNEEFQAFLEANSIEWVRELLKQYNGNWEAVPSPKIGRAHV